MKHVIVVGFGEEKDKNLLAEILSNDDLDIIFCSYFEMAAEILSKGLAYIAIIGKYVPNKNQILAGEVVDETALKICQQNSEKICQLWEVFCVLADTETNPEWQNKLKRLIRDSR